MLKACDVLHQEEGFFSAFRSEFSESVQCPNSQGRGTRFLERLQNQMSPNHTLAQDRPNDGCSLLQGREVLIRVAIVRFSSLAGSLDQGYCRETHNALLCLILFSLTVHPRGHQ